MLNPIIIGNPSPIKFFILSIFSVSASNIDSEIQKLTKYAEEYESGNINYVQLTLYLANTRQKMNQIFVIYLGLKKVADHV